MFLKHNVEQTVESTHINRRPKSENNAKTNKKNNNNNKNKSKKNTNSSYSY